MLKLKTIFMYDDNNDLNRIVNVNIIEFGIDTILNSSYKFLYKWPQKVKTCFCM